jgi:ATF/CREB family transcription factor
VPCISFLSYTYPFLAALKCRQRKKAWLASLQAKVEYLTNENDRLNSALISSREEISRLSALVAAGSTGPGAVGVGMGVVGVAKPQPQPQPLGVGVGVAVGAGAGRSGYGY